MTKLNQLILDLIRNSEGHLTAEQVFLLAKKKKINVSLASIYRILGKLADEGLINRFSVASKPDVFDKTIDQHAHLICRKCGKVEDVYIKDLKKILCKQIGTDIDSYELNVNCICENCRKKEKTK